MRTRLAPLALLLLCGACCFGAATTGEARQLTASLRTRLDCVAQPFYCGALDRFDAGTEPAYATPPYSLVGRALNLWTREEEIDWFVARGSAMAFGDVIPDDEEEDRELDQLLAILDAGGTVPPTHPVAMYVQSLATGGDEPHATTIRDRARYYAVPDQQADVYVRQNGTEIICVEVSHDGGAIAVFQRPR